MVGYLSESQTFARSRGGTDWLTSDVLNCLLAENLLDDTGEIVSDGYVHCEVGFQSRRRWYDVIPCLHDDVF